MDVRVGRGEAGLGMSDFEAARRNMVDGQLRPNRVTDPALLLAMEVMPRHDFVPKHLRGIAYVDEDIALGGGRYMLEPLVLGRLLQVLEIKPTDTVLNIGCANGFDAAILGRLAASVVAVDCEPAMVARATEILADLGIDNVAVVDGALADGFPQQAPYDVVCFSGAIDDVPAAITAQLTPDGRMAAVIADVHGPQGRGPPGGVAGGWGMGKATLFVRTAGIMSRRVIFDAGTPLLPGFAGEPTFAF